MKRIVLIGMCLMLQGCGPSVSVKSSSPNHVTIESYMLDAPKAQQLADAECAKYNRRARMTLKAALGEGLEVDRDYIFACID